MNNTCKNDIASKKATTDAIQEGFIPDPLIGKMHISYIDGLFAKTKSKRTKGT